MKKNIQTLFIALFTALSVHTAVFADTTLNSPAQMPIVTISSSSGTNCSTGVINGCWKQTDTANPGDMVAVQVYYRNTGNETAQDVAIAMTPQSVGSTTNATFRGGVAAMNADQSTGSASVRISGNGSSLTYVSGSARWYSTISNGPHGVNDTRLFDTGYIIGDIAPGEQGVLVANFRVSGTSNDDNDTCSISNFSPSERTIDRGDSTQLYWSTKGCDYVNISSVGSGFSPNGNRSVSPSDTRTYTLTAYPGGYTARTTVYVRDTENTSCGIDYFTVGGASSVTINRGDSVVMRWGTTNASSVDISPNFSNRSNDGSLTISPYTSTTYTITAQNNNCSRTQTATVYVREVDTQTKPRAITTAAILLGNTSAQINGIAVPNTSATTYAWFEWGTSTAFGNRTQSQQVVGANSANYGDTLSNLSTKTTYYYRAVVQNNNGIAYGDPKIFKTQDTYIVDEFPDVTPPKKNPVKSPSKPKTVIRYVSVPTQNTNVIIAKSAPSLLELRVESNFDHMCIGGTTEYTVTYRNISGIDLQDTVIRIVLPKELTYVASSKGYYEADTKTLTVVVGRIAPHETNILSLRTTTNSEAVRGALPVTTATVVYTNSVTRAQENAIAYSLISVSDTCPTIYTNQVTQSGWWFLPHTLIEWLLLIVIILALIVLAQHLRRSAHTK